MRHVTLLALSLMALTIGCSRTPPPVYSPPPITALPPEDIPTADSHSPVEEVEVEDFRIGSQRYNPRFVEEQWRAHLANGGDATNVVEHRELLIDEIILQRALETHPTGDDPIFRAQVAAQERRLKAQRYIEEVLWDNLLVTDLEVETHWRVQRSRFTEPEQARIHQLQFQTLATAMESHARAVKGTGFDALAEANDMSIIDPGWFSRGQLDRRLEDIAFDLAIGEVSNVISTETGHHLLTRVGSIPPRLLPLDEVAPQIRRDLLAVRRAEALRDFLKRRRLDEGIPGDPVLIP